MTREKNRLLKRSLFGAILGAITGASLVMAGGPLWYMLITTLVWIAVIDIGTAVNAHRNRDA